MTLSTPVKVGIIGCGRISQSYFDAISQLPGVRLKALMDVRPEAANALAELSGAAPFYQIENYLAQGNTEVTIVCSPPATHAPIVRTLLAAGQHVLCEKPLALNLSDSLSMHEAANQSGRCLMMASKFRYVDDVIKAKTMISSGILGKLLFYENCFSGYVNMAERWNADLEISGGGVIIDNGTHAVDIVRYLLGPIESVKAIHLGVHTRQSPEDTAIISVATQSGIHGVIHLSWNFSIDRNAYIGVYGSEARLRVNWEEASYQYHRTSQWIPFGYGYSKLEAFKKQVVNFIDTIKGNGTPLIDPADALASVAVIEAAYRSLRSGKWEEIHAYSI